MTRTFKLMALGVLGGWLLTSTACEDKVCQEQLKTCKKESADQRTECAANLAKLQDLKGQLAGAQTKVDNLTKENDELKAAAEAAAKSKGKAAKGKHRKKGKK